MKKALLTLMCMAAMMAAGTSLKAQEVTIVLMPGWTWISIPSTDTLDFATALGSFTPEVGDLIASQWGNAVYMGNGQWRGSVSQFYPGYGYKYKSTRTVPVMLTFNAQQPAPQVVVTTSEPTDITTNSATCGGNVASSSGDYVFVFLRGICWSTNPNPTFNDNYIEAGNGLGSFTVSMTELTSGSTYYVRAFAVTPTGTFYSEEVSFGTESGSNVPTGAINGKFTINENGDQVYFSQGNLQYQASTNTWRFAEHQWDYVGTQSPDNLGNCGGTVSGSDNRNISSTYSGWIDLFGWGTSGYNHGANCYLPWSTSTNWRDYYAYGNSQYNLYDQTGQADWGYNIVINGESIVNFWRTLTRLEWNYVFNTRTTISSIRYAKAIVNNVNGVILLPDDWSSSTYSLNNTNSSSANFSSNTISSSQWNILEDAGAIFLPAAGYRNGISVNKVGSWGIYWSASYLDSDMAFDALFYDNILDSNDHAGRYGGNSVRLVHFVE